MSIKVREGGAWVEVSSGDGVGIQDNDSLVGTATTINFGTNISVSPISAGIVTVTGGSVTSTWTLGANGSSHYTFTGPGGLSNTDDPKIYLARGQTYEFVNNSGGSHPFQIQQSNGSAYNTGVTNNGASSGTIRFEVPFSAPNILQYKCTSHSSMGNTIIIYSGGGGSGQIIKNGSYVTGHGTGAQTIIQTTTWTSLKINGGTGQVAHNITKPSADVLAFNKVSNNSHLEIACYFPVYMNYAVNYNGIRLMSSHDGGSNYYQTSGLTEGPYSSWGAAGGGKNSADGSGFTESSIVSYIWNTSDNTSQSSTWLTKTGECRFAFEVRNYQSNNPTGFISYWIDYTNVEPIDYPRVGKVIIREVVQ